MKWTIIRKVVFATVISILSSVCLCNSGFSQTDQRQDAMKALKELANKYYTIPQLSFDITCRYAEENNPTNYLESIDGKFKMSGDKYWYKLDSTEMIGNKDITVMLFKEDQIVYLAKPSRQLQSNNPLAMLDSVFFNNPSLSFSIVESENERKIQVTSANGTYKKVEYDIDKKTGLINKIISIVNAALLYDESIRTHVDGTSNAIVEVLLSNYQFQSFDTSVFDTSNYFRKEGQQYVTAPGYQTFKIFLGSPNL